MIGLLLALAGCGAPTVPAPPAPAPPMDWLAFVGELQGGGRDVCLVPAAGGAMACPPGGRGAFPGPPDPRGEALLLVLAEDLADGAHRERLALLEPEGRRTLTGWAGMVRNPSWAPDGSSILVESDAEGFRDLWRVARGGGEPVPVAQHPLGNFEPDVHPRGDRVVFVSSRTGDAELHVTEGGAVRLLHASPGDDMRPHWRPQGDTVAFLSAREGRRRVWLLDQDGRARPLSSASDGMEHHDLAWAPDGRHLAVVATLEGGPGRILVVDAESGALVGRLPEQDGAQHPAWSPDGEWLAWTCDAGGRSRVCVATPKGRSDRVVVDLPGGHAWLPRWVPAGAAARLSQAPLEAR